MNKLKILVVEGNTKEEKVNFNQAGCVSQSENFSEHIKMHEPGCEVDIIEPADNSSMERIISSLKKYNGIILTGSTLRINDNSEEVKKQPKQTEKKEKSKTVAEIERDKLDEKFSKKKEEKLKLL